MANVVDPNSWRMAPLPDPHPSTLSRSGLARPEAAATSGATAVTRLAAALDRTFYGTSDRVLWRLQRADGEQQFRIDAGHDFARDAAAKPLEARTTPDAEPRWLVLVQTAEEMAGESGSSEMRAALEQDARLLLIVCGVNSVGKPGAGQRNLAERVASRLRFRYLEPQSLSNEDDLIELLADVKQDGNSSVLYFDAAIAPPAPHFTRADQPASHAAVVESTYFERALNTLRDLQTADPRVVFFSTESDRDGADALLHRSQTLAATGRRVCVFLSVDEALDSLSTIRRTFAEHPSAITLVVEARGDGDGNRRSSHLAAFRELPEVRILAPKDGFEMSQMLRWCMEQPTPSIIWLAETALPPVTWPRGDDVASGRAERLGAGADVALVAWGATSTAAAIAAENLAQLKIRATVVNARFAQPLDIDCFANVCAESAYTVILDDCDTGGFAAWACEQLVRRGNAPNMTIVSADATSLAGDRDLHQTLANLVVRRCRWLGDHLSEPAEVAIETVATTVPPCVAQSNGSPTLPFIELAGGPDVQAQVLATQFSPFIADWVKRYDRVGSRDVYLWRWCLHGLDLTTLSCVAPALRRDLCDTKLLAVMYGVMLDDVADHAGEEVFLAALTGIIAGRAERDFSGFSTEQQEYAQFTCDLWDTFRNRLQSAPLYDDYTELLEYDHQQILNTFAYSLMVNKEPALLNVQEHDMYQPHNMQMMSFATMDLMWSPSFDRAELGRLREVIWHAQSMGRIGNLVSTWQREISDRDFTSGVFARALREGDLSLDDLAGAAPAAIEAAVSRGEHEQYFLLKWEAHRQSIASLAAGIRSVNIATLLEALVQLLRMELYSRGFK